VKFGFIGITFFLASCSGNHPPSLQPIADQSASVGVELSIELRASDSDGDSLTFDFDAPSVMDIKSRAQLSAFADNVAIFRWTPQASDRNAMPYAFDFKVSDGHSTTTETVQITVNDAAGGSAPIFRQPLGTGTTLDLSTDKCIDVAIVVEDTDSTMVTLSEVAPTIDGAMLTQTDPFMGTWHWCPSAAQIAAQDRYLLQLLADDGTNQTTKSYLIVLRTPSGMNCPGAPPAITTTPLTAQSTISDLQVSAEVTDDKGVKSVLLYWTTTMPADPPDIASMTPVAMTLSTGDALDGTYGGSIPNPVAGMAAGTKVTVYYIIEAKDKDDPTGTCNHLVDSPMTGTYAVDVTAPSGMQGTGVNCDPCTKDVQCSTGYECIQIGSSGTFCARECTGNPPCDNMYSCSTSPLTSVDGHSSRYCRASSMTCPPMLVCNDDSLEPNNSRTTITDPTSMNLPFTNGVFSQNNLVMCPINGGTAANEDWYEMSLPDAFDLITAQINLKDYATGLGHSDLDLELVDNSGGILDYSYGTGNTEYAAACVPMSATHAFAHVFVGGTTYVASKYDMTVTRTGPDPQEAVGDNNHETNVSIPTTGGSISGNICGSEDWLYTVLVERERLAVDLKYTSKSYTANDDLTLQVMRDNCSSGATPTAVAAGAPVDGGLRVDYNSPDGGGDCYYVVVGAKYEGGGNTYQINSVSAP
jgi:hypothetical protein